MTTDELIDAVAEWGQSHKINNPIMQYAKVTEEVGEIAHELTRGHYDTPELIDALGDSTVTLIILADILGYDLRACLREAYEEIKNRHGKTVDGSFVKEEQ